MLWRVFTLAAVAVSVAGHGRLAGPPSRASMWRYGFPTSPNYDDDGVNCGGFYHQHSINGGQCGICGDPFDMSEPRTHELGGRYGKGIIVADFEEGEVFTATVIITAYHKGYWVLKLCDDPFSTDQKCFDGNPVELEEGGTKYYPPHGGEFRVNYRLPEGFACDHCVLQWRYIAGNNWGVCGNGTEGLGCGNQETFGACADISIRQTKYIPVESGPIPLSLLESLSAQGLLDLIHIATINSYRIQKEDTKKIKKKNHRKPRKKKPSKRKKGGRLIYKYSDIIMMEYKTDIGVLLVNMKNTVMPIIPERVFKYAPNKLANMVTVTYPPKVPIPTAVFIVVIY